MARITRRFCVVALGVAGASTFLGCGKEFSSFHPGDAGPDTGAEAGGAEATGGKHGTGGRRSTGGAAGTGGVSGASSGGAGAAGAGGTSGSGGIGGTGSGGQPPNDSGSAEASSGEAGSDPCEAAPPVIPGAIVAHCAIGAPPAIDGRLDDWPPQYFTNDVNRLGGEPYGLWSSDESLNAANLSAAFAVRWDRDAIYVAAQIHDDVRSAPDAVHFYVNDAFELFLDGNDDEGEYGSDDIQLLFDAMGRMQANHFPTLDPYAVPIGVTSAAASSGVAANWTVEVRVAWSVLGSSLHTIGDVVGFDVGLDDNDSGTRDRAIIWRNRAPTGCACAMAPNPNPCEPYCYAGTFYKVQLGGK